MTRYLLARAVGAAFTLLLVSLLVYVLLALAPGDPDGMAALFGSKGAFNSFNLQDEQVDDLFAKGVATIDEGQRKSIYGDLQKRLVQDLATVVPIYFQVGFYATTRKVHDFYPHPLELIDVSEARIE